MAGAPPALYVGQEPAVKEAHEWSRGHPAHYSDRTGDTVRLQAFPVVAPLRSPLAEPPAVARVQTESPSQYKSVTVMILASPPLIELHNLAPYQM